MEPLKGSQRKYLRAQAHHLKPLVIIGVKGVTPQLLDTIDVALRDHELIKVKFSEFKESKKEISEEIAKATESEQVGLIGNIAILYRQQRDPEKRKFKISLK
jgi:RNA-binding protein